MINNPYLNPTYNRRARWATYFLQWRTIINTVPSGAAILEVGAGSRTVATQLKQMGYSVTIVDHDSRVEADIQADILSLPFKDNSYDLILAAEILEHLPFSDAQKALAGLKRVTRSWILISVPDRRPVLFSIKIKMPFLREKKILIKIPFRRRSLSSREHQWEIGYQSFSLKFVRQSILSMGFAIHKDFVSIDAPHIHFFLLKK
jgi:ubiquinone/menaquinone biosynthesis C-methylase UbiE